MDTQEKILRELLAISKENRDMLTAINSQRRLSNVFFFIKWTIVIALAYGAYQAAQPFIETASQTVNQINSLTNDPFKNLQKNVINQVQSALKAQ